MKPSLSYYIVLFILKMKGLKKDFSNDPIDYKKIRKKDIHKIKDKFFKGSSVNRFKVKESYISEVKNTDSAKKLLIFIHGGAFVSGPAQVHWDACKEIVRKSDHVLWLCDYPKAPENKISSISDNIDAVYEAALEKYPAEHISIIGDSVGGTLIIALTQRLIQNKEILPRQILLLSPVMDASMTNPEIDKIDKSDPMLSKAGVLSGKKMCAENNDLSNPMISPLNGSFQSFPKTIFFLAGKDITYPDQKLAIKKMQKANVELTIYNEAEMPHIWPILPVMKEARVALNEIIRSLDYSALPKKK